MSKNLNTENKQELKNAVIKIITNELTIGRTNNNLQPYSETQINDFIQNHEIVVTKTAFNMLGLFKKSFEKEINKVHVDNDEIKVILRDLIHIMIKNDFTIGRTNNDLEPFDDDKINQFIEKNKNNIERVINSMITDYGNDNELELLKNPEYDWVQEYLVEEIDTSTKVDLDYKETLNDVLNTNVNLDEEGNVIE